MQIIIKPASLFNSDPNKGILRQTKILLSYHFKTDFSINLDTTNNELIFTEE